MSAASLEYRNSEHEAQGDLRQLLKNFISLKNKPLRSKDQTLEILKKGKEDLLAIKRELSDSAKEQAELYDVMRKRIHKQEEIEQESQKNEEKRAEFQLTSDVLQYLLSHGETDKAKKLLSALKQEVIMAQLSPCSCLKWRLSPKPWLFPST